MTDRTDPVQAAVFNRNRQRMTPKEAAEELHNLMHDADSFRDVVIETDSEGQPVIRFRARDQRGTFRMTITREIGT